MELLLASYMGWFNALQTYLHLIAEYAYLVASATFLVAAMESKVVTFLNQVAV
jgi:hypothetical protein